jgi:hypothetical protein
VCLAIKPRKILVIPNGISSLMSIPLYMAEPIAPTLPLNIHVVKKKKKKHDFLLQKKARLSDPSAHPLLLGVVSSSLKESICQDYDKEKH